MTGNRRSSLDDEDDEKEIAYLPEVGDFALIDRVHTGKGTSGTFCYELEGRGVYFIMIKADRVTIPQRVRAQAHRGLRFFLETGIKQLAGSTPVVTLRRRKGTSR